MRCHQLFQNSWSRIVVYYLVIISSILIAIFTHAAEKHFDLLKIHLLNKYQEKLLYYDLQIGLILMVLISIVMTIVSFGISTSLAIDPRRKTSTAILVLSSSLSILSIFVMITLTILVVTQGPRWSSSMDDHLLMGSGGLDHPGISIPWLYVEIWSVQAVLAMGWILTVLSSTCSVREFLSNRRSAGKLVILIENPEPSTNVIATQGPITTTTTTTNGVNEEDLKVSRGSYPTSVISGDEDVNGTNQDSCIGGIEEDLKVISRGSYPYPTSVISGEMSESRV